MLPWLTIVGNTPRFEKLIEDDRSGQSPVSQKKMEHPKYVNNAKRVLFRIFTVFRG